MKNKTLKLSALMLAAALVFAMLLVSVPDQAEAAPTYSTSNNGFTMTISDFKKGNTTIYNYSAYNLLLVVRQPDPAENPGEYSFTYYGSIVSADDQTQAVYLTTTNGPMEGTFTWDDCTRSCSIVQTHERWGYSWTVTFTHNAYSNHSSADVVTEKSTCCAEGTVKQVCTKCTTVTDISALPIDPDAHSYTYTDLGNGSHSAVCAYNASHNITSEACSGGTASCLTPAICSKCGAFYGSAKPHSWTQWQYDADAFPDLGHYRTCTVCNPEGNAYGGVGYEFEWHTYKPATCVSLSRCDCGSTSGYSYGSHAMTYTKDGNTIRQVCANSASHNAVISLAQDDTVSTVYTGQPIEALKPVIDGYKYGDVTVTYTDNVNAGVARGTVTLGGVSIEREFQISARPLAQDDLTIVLERNTYDYDGQEHKPTAVVMYNGTTLTEGTDYDLYYMDDSCVRTWYDGAPVRFFGFQNVECINAGHYYAAVHLKGNYEQTGTSAIYASYRIEKATVTEPVIENKPYNGALQTADVPANECYTVTENQGGILAGKYNVVLTLKDPANYAWSATDESSVTLVFEITRPENEWTLTPAIDGWTYGEEPNAPVSAAKYGDVFVQYEGTANDGSTYFGIDAPTKAGSYTATFVVQETEDYKGLEEIVPFTIEKADCDMSGARWDYSGAIDYDGKTHSVWFDETSLPDGVTVSNYTGNTASKAGQYTANVSLIYDTDNYNVPSFDTLLNWEIKNDWVPTQYSTTEPNENGWMNEHFVITADDGYQISTVNTNEGPWEDTLYDVMQTDSGSMTFYLRNEQTGLISRAGEVSYKVDYTNPAGQLDFVDRAFWQEFLNHITFDLFYRDEVIVRVEAMDDLSGVASVEYASADRAMTLEEVKAITDWTMYENSFGVSVEDAKRFVYFVRITDLAGNVTYISSDGAEYDTTAPEIRGIADGATYYTTRQVCASDRNLDTVRCNEADVASDFTIAGDVDAVYTITAEDRAGNQTTVSVTMLPISTLAEKIDGLTTETVKSSDAPAVQAVLQAADTVDPDSATDEEKQAIGEILDRAQGLDDVIDDVQEQMQRTDRQADGYDESTVNSDDKAALQQLLKDIEVLTDGDNLTDAERAQLNDTAKKLEGMIAAIDEAADAADTEHTDKVQDVTADNVTAEDRDDLQQAKDDLTQALQQQGDHYTDEEKKAIEADIDRIDDALDALDRADGVRQLIDSLPETITKEDADAVKAADDAYNALSAHERDLVGAQAQKTLEDAKAALAVLNVPKTGDDSNPAVWIVHLFVSISAICALYLAGKRRKSMN